MSRSTSIENVLEQALIFDLPKTTDESEWPFDWEDVQCGTPHPIPRDNHATLWMTCNFSDSTFQDISDFFQMAKERLTATVHRLSESKVVVRNSSGDTLLEGFMHTGHPEANVGRYVMFQASSEAGCELIIKISSFSQWGYRTYVFHDKVLRQIDGNKELIVTTGLGADGSDDKGLSTRLDLRIENDVAARCHLSYRDVSMDPSIGPTVEMIAVHRDYRGRKLLSLLWFWVKTFIEDNFILESLNTDAPAGHLQIKATKLTNNVIEVDDNGDQITHKQFFFDWAGFSVRKQINPGKFWSGVEKRPIDEEGVLYIPLLSQQKVRERAERRFVGDDALDFQNWKRTRGARNCRTCQIVKSGLLRCSRCKKVSYCSVQCQKKDFREHKLWCGKTRQQVTDELARMSRKGRCPLLA
eukprot:scaffold23803_cov132-Cylindrotheca_fusiformis.AAC.1